jgi:hypothetical protein
LVNPSIVQGEAGDAKDQAGEGKIEETDGNSEAEKDEEWGGRMEGWKGGRLEGWRSGRMEGLF